MDLDIKRVKIVFLIPTLRFGGAELFLLRLVAKICEDYRVVLVVIGEREGLFIEFEKLNIRVIYLGYENIFYFPLSLISFRRILKVEKPDILQSFLYLADILAGVSSYKLDIRQKIWSLRGTNLARGTEFHKRLIQKIAALLSNHLPNKIIACSSQVSNFHIENGYPKERVVVIGNFMPAWTIGNKSNSQFLFKEKPISFSIGIAARYDIGKGHLALTQCVGEFLEKNSNYIITLRFAGKGCGRVGVLGNDVDSLPGIKDLISRGMLKIEYYGLLSGLDLPNWFKKLDLYFMSSDSLEGFPNALAEAVAIGMPAISTPVGSASDFLPTFRIAVDPSVSRMRQVLESFLNESLTEKLDVSKIYQAQLLSKFSEDKVIESYKDIWRT